MCISDRSEAVDQALLLTNCSVPVQACSRHPRSQIRQQWPERCEVLGLMMGLLIPRREVGKCYQACLQSYQYLRTCQEQRTRKVYNRRGNGQVGKEINNEGERQERGKEEVWRVGKKCKDCQRASYAMSFKRQGR